MNRADIKTKLDEIVAAKAAEMTSKFGSSTLRVTALLVTKEMVMSADIDYRKQMGAAAANTLADLEQELDTLSDHQINRYLNQFDTLMDQVVTGATNLLNPKQLDTLHIVKDDGTLCGLHPGHVVMVSIEPVK